MGMLLVLASFPQGRQMADLSPERGGGLVPGTDLADVGAHLHGPPEHSCVPLPVGSPRTSLQCQALVHVLIRDDHCPPRLPLGGNLTAGLKQHLSSAHLAGNVSLILDIYSFINTYLLNTCLMLT